MILSVNNTVPSCNRLVANAHMKMTGYTDLIQLRLTEVQPLSLTRRPTKLYAITGFKIDACHGFAYLSFLRIYRRHRISHIGKHVVTYLFRIDRICLWARANCMGPLRDTTPCKWLLPEVMNVQKGRLSRTKQKVLHRVIRQDLC